jgi:hypothetical protein
MTFFNSLLVVVAALNKIDSVFSHHVNQSVFLGDSSGPDTATQKFQGLRLADAVKRLSHYGIDQFENSECCFAIGFNPVA